MILSKKFFWKILICMIFLLFSTAGWASDNKGPIKIGVPSPMTGPYVSDALVAQQGVKFAVEDINAAGGLLGRKLEIIQFDTQEYDPALMLRAADKLCGKDKVDSLHSGWAGWGQDVQAFGRYDVPFFHWDASISSIEVFRGNKKQYSNVFMLDDVEEAYAIDEFDVMLGLPYKHPNKKIAIIVSDDSWGRETGSGWAKRAKENGWEVVLHEVVPYGTREWGPILTKIRALEPALIHVEIVSSPDVITFFRQFKKDPTNSLINFGYALSLPDFIGNLGKEADGLMGMSLGMPSPDAPTPEANDWLKRFRESYGQDAQASSMTVYSGVMMWAEAVRHVGDPTNYKAINKHLASMSFETLHGVTWKFDEDQKLPVTTAPCYHTQAQDGKVITIYSGPGKPYKDFKFQKPIWVK